jgi:hypothetical protein
VFDGDTLGNTDPASLRQRLEGWQSA